MSVVSQRAVVVALGGNLGGPDIVCERFSDVIRAISTRWGTPLVSGNYLTAPVGPVQEQPDFVNAVAAWWPELVPTPEDALAMLQSLEVEHGRERILAGGARTLDLDLLLHAGEVRERTGLRIPHPRMADRAFVLQPLQELFGDEFRWAVESPTVAELLLKPSVAAQRCVKRGRT